MEHRITSLALVLNGLLAALTQAHEVRPAYLEVRRTADDTYDALWKVPALEDRRLGIYVQWPDDVIWLTEPHGTLSGDAYLERWHMQCPGGLAGREIRIEGLESTQIDVLVRVELETGAIQTARVLPSSPSFVVEAAPSAWDVAGTYLLIGIEHIILGIDHLLFVLALLMLVKGTRRLVATITTFTVAHSLTLACAVLEWVHVPAPPVETCIALSIVFVAAEIVRKHQGQPGLTAQAPWIIAFTFGLLHGLGFAGALSEVGLPASAIPVALLFFNIGVEIGQLAFVAVAVAVIRMVERGLVRWPRWAAPWPAYPVGGCATFWVIQRVLSF